MISKKYLKQNFVSQFRFKKVLFLVLFIGLLGFFGKTSNAQIALQYNDTTICPGTTITMCAALTGQASSLDNDDGISTVIPIGFPFKFFGTTYTSLVASGNAFVSFNTSLASTYGPWYYNQPGFATYQQNTIFVAFADWYLPNGGVIRYAHFGATGHRKFIMEWCHIPAFINGNCTDEQVTTQLILYEGTNIIEVHTTHLPILVAPCPTASPNQRVVQGVENSTGTLSYFPQNRDPLGPLASNWGNTGINNDARRFTPIGGTPFIYKIDTIPYAPLAVIDSSEAQHFKWYNPNNLTTPITVGACATVTPTTQPYYLVNYTGYLNCQDTNVNITDTVFIHYATKYDTINKSICYGESYYFLGRHLFKSGQYDTLFQSFSGCDSFITLNLTVNPLPDVSTFNKTNLDFCQGDSVRIGVSNPEGTTAYQWTQDGTPIAGADQPTYIVHQPGTYVLNATTNKGCTASMIPINVTVHNNPVAKITPLTNGVICDYDTLQLTVQNPDAGSSFIWRPDQPFLKTTGNEGAMVKGVFLKSTEITLTVFNQFGCKDEDSAFVMTKPCCEVFVPNAFSPNGDGVNDYFKPDLQVGQILTSMKIYDRLGQLIYNNQNLKMGWNGNIGDKAAPSDTYMYIIEYTCADGKLYHKKGSVTLIR